MDEWPDSPRLKAALQELADEVDIRPSARTQTAETMLAATYEPAVVPIEQLQSWQIKRKSLLTRVPYGLTGAAAVCLAAIMIIASLSNGRGSDLIATEDAQSTAAVSLTESTFLVESSVLPDPTLSR